MRGKEEVQAGPGSLEPTSLFDDTEVKSALGGRNHNKFLSGRVRDFFEGTCGWPAAAFFKVNDVGLVGVKALGEHGLCKPRGRARSSDSLPEFRGDNIFRRTRRLRNALWAGSRLRSGFFGGRFGAAGPGSTRLFTGGLWHGPWHDEASALIAREGVAAARNKAPFKKVRLDDGFAPQNGQGGSIMVMMVGQWGLDGVAHFLIRRL